MATIDERIEILLAEMKPPPSIAWRARLRTTLLEVARDQRHACADAVFALLQSDSSFRPDTVHQAVMNATIEGESKS